jgi:enolase-phosphatase E1
MDLDRKSTTLKALQGRIWQDGYRNGQLHGQVFPDVPAAFQRWRQRGLDVRIFSSGSKLAQVLLFESTEAGNLTTLLNGYFDTSIGAKADPASYDAIAKAFGLAPEEVLFISDVTKELDAARQSGMATLLCQRPGNPPQMVHEHRAISSFEEIVE